jgi:KDO2-lipid IV(A) lauroyltransferase
MSLTEAPGQATLEEIIEAYARVAEESIREEPESFLWSNRRWKHQPPDDLA